MATLYARDSQYYVNYTLNGRRVRQSVGVNRQEAQIYLQELKHPLFKGDIQPDRPKIPVSYLIKKYLDDCQRRLAPSTRVRYEDALNYFREFITVHSPTQYVDQITKVMLSGYTDFRLNRAKKPKAKTVNIELVVIRAFCSLPPPSKSRFTNITSGLVSGGKVSNKIQEKQC